jgi:hypothetical protein
LFAVRYYRYQVPGIIPSILCYRVVFLIVYEKMMREKKEDGGKKKKKKA